MDGNVSSTKPIVDVSNIKPQTFYEGYHKATGNPLGSAAFLGLGSGLATYAAAPYAMKASFNMMTANMTPQQKQKAYIDMIQHMQENRLKMAGAVGAGAAGLSLYQNYDPAKGMSSLTRWNYMSPEAPVQKQADDQSPAAAAQMPAAQPRSRVLQQGLRNLKIPANATHADIPRLTNQVMAPFEANNLPNLNALPHAQKLTPQQVASSDAAVDELRSNLSRYQAPAPKPQQPDLYAQHTQALAQLGQELKQPRPVPQANIHYAPTAPTNWQKGSLADAPPQTHTPAPQVAHVKHDEAYYRDWLARNKVRHG